MSENIELNGKTYLPASRAAKHVGVTRDYIGRLCREGKIDGRRIGTTWYIEAGSLDQLLVEKQYVKAQRSEELSRQRLAEYRNGNASQSPALVTSVPVRSNTNVTTHAHALLQPESVARPVAAIQRSAAETLRAAGRHIASSAPARAFLEHAPHVGFPAAQAVMQSSNLAHRMLALTFSFALTFGAYGIVDAQYRSIAFETAHAATVTIARIPEETRRIAQNFVVGSESFAARRPSSTEMLAASGDLARTVTDSVQRVQVTFMSALSRITSTVQSFGFGFPSSDSVGNGMVVAHIVAVPSQTPTVSPRGVQTTPKTIIQQPVIERIRETERIVTTGGVSSAFLAESLNQLENKLTSQIFGITSRDSLSVASNYQMIAQTNRIDQLTGTLITNPTISGGSISGTGISASGLTVSGDTTLGSTTASSLTVTGAFSAASFTPTALSVVNATTTNATSTNFYTDNLTLASLSGFLKATAGVISTSTISLVNDISGILGISNGGTGTSTAPTYGKVLLGNTLGTYDLVATSSLGITSATWGAITGTLSDQTDLQSALDAKLNLASWYATTTDGLAEGITNKYWSNTLFDNRLSATTSLPTITTLANLTTLGTIATGVWQGTAIADAYLTKSGDWSGTFDGQQGTYYLDRANHTGTQLASTISDFSTAADLRINATSTIGTLTSAPNLGTLSTSLSGIVKAASGVLSQATAGVDFENPLSFTYPLLRAVDTISLAFGTTTSNTWAGTQTFTNAPVLGSLSGLVAGNSGALYSAATSSATLGLGLSGSIIGVGGSQSLSIATSSLYSGTTGQFPYFSGTNTLTATSSLFVSTAGKIGIGTVTPAEKLHVLSGNIKVSGSGSAFVVGIQSGGGNEWDIRNPSGSDIRFRNGGNDRLIITNAGQATAEYFTAASTTAISTFPRLTSTTATTTNLAISGIASGNLLKTTTGGSVIAAVAGTDYENALSFTYPLTRSTDTISLAFGTTTSNTWAGTQTFTNAPTISSFSGLIGANTGVTYAVSTSTLDIGGNAGTVTNGVYTTTFNSLFDPRFITQLAATTSVASITTLPNLALPYSQLTGAFAFPFTATTNFGAAANSTSTPIWFQGGLQASSTARLADLYFATTSERLALLNGTSLLIASTTNFSTFLGLGAGTTTGSTGLRNTVVGYEAFQANSTGDDNTALGPYALYSNTGSTNTALGPYALYSNTTGSSNIALGKESLNANTEGANNIALGRRSLFSNTTGNNNSALGIEALYSNTIGFSNIAIGNYALASNTTGGNNIALGYEALNANTTGVTNIALGYRSLYTNSTGNNNTAFGVQALNANTTGSNNTALGYQAGYSVTTGYANILFGSHVSTEDVITSGAGNIGIGNEIFFPSTTANNQLNFGNFVFGTLPATSTAFRLPTTGALGIATSSPYATLSIHANNGSTNTTLFAVGSSTASATTTLLSVSNTGNFFVGTSTDQGFTYTPLTSSFYVTSGVGRSTLDFEGTENAFDVGVGTRYLSFADGTFTLGGDQTTLSFYGNASSGDRFNIGSGKLVVSASGFGTTTLSGLTINGSATSTSNVGFNITSGCFAISGNCLSASSLGASTFAFPFTATTNFGAAANSTSTPIWFTAGLQASSTSQFDALATGLLRFNATTSTSTLATFAGQTFLTASTTGFNTSLGLEALASVTGGIRNTALGRAALNANTSGRDNVAMGTYALESNTTGNYNVGIGSFALYVNETGSDNVGIGYNSLTSNETGIKNTVIGSGALGFGDTASNITAIGYLAGNNITSGSANTFIGTLSDSLSSGTIATSTAIGYGAKVGCSNCLVLGGTGLNAVNVGIGTTTPYARLSVVGQVVGEYFTATSTTASVFPYASTTALTISGTGYFGTASTSNLTISNITSGSLLKTTTNGVVAAAVAGIDYLTSSDVFAFPFTATTNFGAAANSTSTPIWFTAGLQASSTSQFDALATGLLRFNATTSTSTLATFANQTFITASSNANNTSLGLDALSNITTGSSNSAFGAQALQQNTSGTNNTAVGYFALNANTTGALNVAVGDSALSVATSSAGNVAVGSQTLVNFKANTANGYNTAVGYSSLTASNFYGTRNSTLGALVGQNVTGSNNTLLGYFAAGNANAASYNTFIGYQAGSTLNSGDGNILIGASQTASNLSSGAGNIGIGNNIFFPSATANNQLNLGNFVFGTLPATSTSFRLPTTGALGIATTSPFATLSVHANNGSTNTTLFAIGSSTASATTTLFSVSNTGTASLASIFTAPVFNASGASTTMLSLDGISLLQASTTKNSYALGKGAGGISGSSNTAIGAWSLYTASTSAATNNTAIGASSMLENQTGDYNTAVGSGALYYNQTGVSNTALGYRSLEAVAGDYNIGIGELTLVGSYLDTDNRNIAIGYSAGSGLTSGSNNLFFGHQVADNFSTGSNNIAIGYAIDLANSNGSNQLNIGNLLFGTGIDGIGTTISSGNIGIATSSPWRTLSVHGSSDLGINALAGSFTATSTTASTFPYASTTALTISGTGYFGTASTSNLTISNITSGSLLKTTTNGVVAAAVAGTDYLTSADTFAFPFTATTNFGAAANSTSTPIWFQSGLQASSTAHLSDINTIGFLNFATTSTNASSTLVRLGGVSFLNASTTGFNTGLGINALSKVTSGVNNTALGYGALSRATSGFSNVGIGSSALSNNTTGQDNTAVGDSALRTNITGSSNVGIGISASDQNESALNTVAVGYSAALGQDIYSARGYTVMGFSAGINFATGADYNTLFGYQAGSAITSGYSNILLGASTNANNLTTGSNTIGVGNNIFFPSATANNQLNLGNFVFGTLPATSTAFRLPTTGALGIASSSPFATLSVHANNGSTNTTLFAIGSSTASATTTLFSVSNTGALTVNASATSSITGGISIAGSIVPAVDNTYSLGSATNMWKDAYIGPGSLYINGKKVIQDVSDTITISTDVDQNLLTQTSGIGTATLRATGSGNVSVTTVSGNIDITSTSGNINIGTSGSGQLNFGTVTSGTWNGSAIGVAYGGSGWNSVESGRILFGNGGSALATSSALHFDSALAKLTVTNASTTALTISGTASTTNLYVSSAGGTAGCATFSTSGLISNTGTACGSGSGTFSWTPTTNFGAAANSTSTPIWFTAGLQASSTSRFEDIALKANSYLNFGNTTGTTGYGFRDNSGTVEFKNSGGAWNSVNTATTGPSFSVHKNGTAQTVTADTWTKLTWETEVFDTNNNFDLSTERFTPTVAGKYLINVSAGCNAVSGNCIAGIYKNGSSVAISQVAQTSAAYDQTVNVTVIVSMNGTTDYVEGYVFNTSTTVYGNSDRTFFTGALIAPINGNNVAGWANDGTSSYLLDNADFVGIGTTTPWGRLSINSLATDGAAPSFVIGSSTATNFIVTNGGKVGVGTTSPFATFGINTVSGTNPFVVGNSVGTQLSISGSGFGTTTLSGLNINGSATSTSNVGFNITSGCFAVNNVCVGGGSGGVGTGTTGQFPYYAADSTTLTATSTLFVNTNSRIGIATSSPLAQLDVYGDAIISGANRYLNFGATSGTTGYGFRDNSGTLEFKNSGGAWNSVNTATSGPSFSVHKNGTAQTVTTGTPTLLTWSTEDFDTNNNFASNRFTPTVAGTYIFTGNVFLHKQYWLVSVSIL